MGQIVHFEDNGQDFLRWTIRDGVVVECEPFQGWIWKGAKILSQPKVGEKLQIETAEGGKGVIQYKVAKIEEEPDMVECVECGAEQADPGVGVRCEEEIEDGRVCGGRLEKIKTGQE